MKSPVRGLAVVIALLLVGDVVALTTIKQDSSQPSAWDPRVATLASFVEDARHLRFDHPVAIEFLTEAAYKARASAEGGELSDDEKKEVEVFQGQARALGLIGQSTNLVDDLTQIASGGTLAYYDDEAEKMVIRGTELTVGLRVTVVHELTHALQDQAFDLSREFDNDGTSSYFRALAEGDAERIENEYIESLSDSEEAAYFNEQDENVEGAVEELADVAPALVQIFAAPYALGGPLATLIVEELGVKGLDKLFRTPPDSDEGLFNATATLDQQTAKKVSAPKLVAGEEENDSGDFGSISWYLVLASFIDQRVAMTAVDGWGGDAYIGYRENNRTCIRIAFEGDTPADTAEMAAALGQWKAAFKENTVAVTATPDRVELDACEPSVVPTPRADAANALVLPATRMQLLAVVLTQGLPRATADCAVRHFIAQVPLDKLTSESAADQQLLFDLGSRVGRGCASGQLK